jgi:hypothetical protein
MNRLHKIIASIREIELYQGLFHLGLLLLVAGIIVGWVVNPLWRGLGLLSAAMIWLVSAVIESKSSRASGFETLMMAQVCLILTLLALRTLIKSIPLP